jgi:ATP-dependent RNA helicase DDX21
MLNMGFADDVETVLEGVGSANNEKTQCLLFSATTPSWVKNIGKQYQENVLSVDATAGQSGARTATTVRHLAVQLPPGKESKMAILEDIIAVEISKDKDEAAEVIDAGDNPIAAAAAVRKGKTNSAMQQKIFGKTIVFTQTKREADELVSGSIFKSLTAQALHGDVGQKQRDATLAAFRQGAFNVLVATDVAARGIDINDVDLVIQFDPPRDVDTYVHRSGRTGRAGNKGVSVLLFNPGQSRDIVRIERDLGHGFKFELAGPPSIEAALKAAAKTSAIACRGVPDETAQYFKDSAKVLLAETGDAEEVVARCLAAISRRSATVESRSLLTGEPGLTTVEMSNSQGRPVTPRDVMFTVGKLARMSQKDDGDTTFDSDVGKIQSSQDSGTAVFDMSIQDAKALVEFSKDIEAGGAVFALLKELEVERGRDFGRSFQRSGGGGRGGGRYGNSRGGGGGGGGGGGYQGRGSGGGGSYGGGRDNSRRGGQRSSYQGGNSRSSNSRDRNDGGGGGGRYSRDGPPRRDGPPSRGGEGGGRNGATRRYDGNSQGGGGGGNDGW